MKTTEYIAPSGAKVIVLDPESSDFQKRAEKAVAALMSKVVKVRN